MSKKNVEVNDPFLNDEFTMDIPSAADESAELEAVNQPEQVEKPKEDVKQEPEPESDGMTEELKQEYMQIFDSVMFDEGYEEVIPLGGKYKATFRSRQSGDDLEIAKRLDGMVFNTAVAYQNQSAVLTLAYTLVQYNNHDMRNKNVQERYKFLLTLNSTLIVLLSKKLAEFDQKLYAALEYGQANF